MIHRASQIAVLTGDLVASTALDPAQIGRAFRAISSAVDLMREWQDARPVLSRSRGDGWQIRIGAPTRALRAALLVRAALLAEDAAFETRIAIATGGAEDGTPQDLNEATGPVFVASGRALDSMPAGALMAHAQGGALAAATRLADHISRGWTQPQAAAVLHALAPVPPTQAEIGAALGKSRQAVSQALAAAGYPALSEALAHIETTP